MLDLCLQPAPARGMRVPKGTNLLPDDCCVPGCGLSIQGNYPLKFILTGIQGDSRKKVKDNETSAFS